MSKVKLRGPRQQRGVSLVEAVVAMAVMAFGLLAVVGLQATLRANGDLSRQRAEAVRIAQRAIEDWRSYTVMSHTAGALAYDDLISDGAPVAVADPGHQFNATYMLMRSVTPLGSPPLKTLAVTVSWSDRSGAGLQSVQVNSVVAGVVPELAGSLALPYDGTAGQRPLGRSPSIPVLAKDLGDGRSGFVPPGQGSGTVAWIFSNTTGLITGVCTASGVANSNLLNVTIANTCASITAQLLSGYVSFAATATQPDATEAASPTGLARNLDVTLSPGPTSAGLVLNSACFDDAAAVEAAAVPGGPVSYFCAIFSGAAQTWAGRSRIDPSVGGWTITSSGASNKKVCRYTTLADDGNASSKNADHPLDYTEAGSAKGDSLTNQNFLVISAAHVCPSDTAVTSTHFVNANTRLHQDGSTAYSNP